jgi:peroxiredoxin
MNAQTTVGATTDWRSRTRESKTGTVLVLAVTAALVAGAAYLLQRPAADASVAGVTAVTLVGDEAAAPVIGTQPAAFTATTVDGKPISLASLKGHPVWLTFGASWCASCVAEAPDIQAAYERAKASGAVVVEVFLNEDAASVKDYAERVGLTYPAIADPQTDIASAYRVIGIPAHFFIDSTGVLRDARTGSMSSHDMDSALQGIS